jgi:hypothetical protein
VAGRAEDWQEPARDRDHGADPRPAAHPLGPPGRTLAGERTSHDRLRHTFATLQLAAGTNPKIVREALGHKKVAITLDRYSHALPTLHTKAMARLDAILGRGADAAPRTLGDEGSNRGSPTAAGQTKGPIQLRSGR